MATPEYRKWNAAGRPFSLAKPIAELVAWAKANGVAILGTIGNEDHLTKDKPEDHTPFSCTEWPVALSGYIVCAIDLKNVRGLGDAIERQARAGRLPWLKYMNHSGQNISFKGPTPVESGSSDEHVHLSIRTDWASRSIGTFNPWEEDDMSAKAESQINSVYTGMFNGGSSMGRSVDPDGTGARPTSNSLIAKFDYLLQRVDALAARPAAAPVALTEADRDAIAAKVVAQLSTTLELAFRRS
jgi:hypothetical protein